MKDFEFNLQTFAEGEVTEPATDTEPTDVTGDVTDTCLLYTSKHFILFFHFVKIFTKQRFFTIILFSCFFLFFLF